MAMPDKVSLAKSLRPPAKVVVQVHGWYPIVVLVMVFVAVSGMNMLFTLHINNERQKADRQAAIAAAEASRQQSCRLIVAFDDLYRETPPTTPAGQNVARLWASYRSLNNC